MKILLARIKKETDFVPVPHLGLGILSSVLRDHGHDVLVLDELLFVRGKRASPGIRNVMIDFKPDLVGFSVYTATFYETMNAVLEARIAGVPIILGGPHVTLHQAFSQYEKQLVDHCDYVVKGEAEPIIVELVRKARLNDKAVIIDGETADLDTVPQPDFTTFMNWESISEYPLSTSRGCPFACSFCAVKHISPKGWRSRPIGACLDEIERAVSIYPRLKEVQIVDDCPTLDPDRFKTFLMGYFDKGIDLRMSIANIRADSIDEEMVTLAKHANNKMIRIGVESGNEVVFNAIGKKESLSDIKRAAKLIKQGGLKLGACFIIGLPYDTLQRTWDSINLAKELNADSIIWNLAHPMEKTRMLEWFLEHGAEVGEIRGYSSYEHHSVKLRNKPVVETEDFTAEEREKAYFMACVETGQYAMETILSDLFYLVYYSIKYRYPPGVTKGIPGVFRIVLGYIFGRNKTVPEMIEIARGKLRLRSSKTRY